MFWPAARGAFSTPAPPQAQTFQQRYCACVPGQASVTMTRALNMPSSLPSSAVFWRTGELFQNATATAWKNLCPGMNTEPNAGIVNSGMSKPCGLVDKKDGNSFFLGHSRVLVESNYGETHEKPVWTLKIATASLGET